MKASWRWLAGLFLLVLWFSFVEEKGELFFLVPCCLLFRLFAWTYLFRAWKALQLESVRTTPAKAIGFLFIPIFNLYWALVAYVDLAKDWNRVVRTYPNLAHAPQLSPPRAFLAALLAGVTMTVLIIALLLSPEGTALSSVRSALLILNIAWLGAELLCFEAVCRGVNHMGALHYGHLDETD